MFYGGELVYKQQWCTGHLPLRRLVVYRNTVLNRALDIAERRLRANAAALRAARGMKRALAQVVG
jgi:hypothetical protein